MKPVISFNRSKALLDERSVVSCPSKYGHTSLSEILTYSYEHEVTGSMDETLTSDVRRVLGLV